VSTGFEIPDDYDEIVAERKAALLARQDALLEYDESPTENEAIALILDAASSGSSGIDTQGSFVYDNYSKGVEVYPQIEYTYDEESELFSLEIPGEYRKWEDNDGWFVGPNLMLPVGYYNVSCLADIAGAECSLGFVVGTDVWYFPSDTRPLRNYTQTFWLDEETTFGMYMYPSDGVSLLYVRLKLVVRKLG